ncbi:MAG TPA: hypothetical protein VGP01_01245, partial [Rhizomicrobium sp.]|nr:hypothetical protein [Rhizomicrobium sp.]
TDMETVQAYPYNLGIYKINIPATERLKVLGMLDVHNLNAFSLFGSEEGLMQTLARREFFLRPER